MQFRPLSQQEEKIAKEIVDAAFTVHKNLGPGLLESAYENALAYDIKQIGFDVKQQVPMPFIYKEVKLEVGYRIDILINKKVIIEVKAVEALAPVHFAQLLTYLKLSDIKLGLLINFNSKTLKNNIHRIVNKL